MRIGHGFDAHRLGDGDHVVLGGVRIDCDHSLIAHSDGDVVIHALCDALLGAAALGDIGRHFPDTDPRWAGVDSRHFLRHVRGLLEEKGWACVNADVTLVAEAPRVAPFIEGMRANLAADLAVKPGTISLKATTTEGMGYIGRREGIAAHAVALLRPLDV